jgi:ankyrin repeat protein
MNLPPPPPPQDDHPIITQFEPVKGQWELTDENIKHIDSQTGRTILHNYCRHINTTPLEVYRFLIETKGCDVNVQDEDKDTPLILALRYFKGGDIAVLTYLLTQKGINVNLKGQSGYTILHTACNNIKYLPLDVFQHLIETHSADVNAQNDNKDTPVFLAFHAFDPDNGGDITVLTYLLNQKNVNGNIKGEDGYTLLHLACGRINELPFDVFKLLIEKHGCDVNVQDNSKNTPVHHALRNFNLNNGIKVLTYFLTQTNINVDIKDQRGWTLLHMACININNLPIDIFKLLIETMSCDVNVQNNDNDNDIPLHNALRHFDPNKGGDIKALAYLINQKNVNVNTKDKSDHTLLHTACIINLQHTWHSAELNAKCDTISCQIVEVIIERCIEEVLDDTITF